MNWERAEASSEFTPWVHHMVTNSTNQRHQNHGSQFTDDAAGSLKSCVTSPRPQEYAAKLDKHPAF